MTATTSAKRFSLFKSTNHQPDKSSAAKVTEETAVVDTPEAAAQLAMETKEDAPARAQLESTPAKRAHFISSFMKKVSLKSSTHGARAEATVNSVSSPEITPESREVETPEENQEQQVSAPAEETAEPPKGAKKQTIVARIKATIARKSVDLPRDAAASARETKQSADIDAIVAEGEKIVAETVETAAVEDAKEDAVEGSAQSPKVTVVDRIMAKLPSRKSLEVSRATSDGEEAGATDSSEVAPEAKKTKKRFSFFAKKEVSKEIIPAVDESSSTPLPAITVDDAVPVAAEDVALAAEEVAVGESTPELAQKKKRFSFFPLRRKEAAANQVQDQAVATSEEAGASEDATEAVIAPSAEDVPECDAAEENAENVETAPAESVPTETAVETTAPNTKEAAVVDQATPDQEVVDEKREETVEAAVDEIKAPEPTASKKGLGLSFFFKKRTVERHPTVGTTDVAPVENEEAKEAAIPIEEVADAPSKDANSDEPKAEAEPVKKESKRFSLFPRKSVDVPRPAEEVVSDTETPPADVAQPKESPARGVKGIFKKFTLKRNGSKKATEVEASEVEVVAADQNAAAVAAEMVEEVPKDVAETVTVTVTETKQILADGVVVMEEKLEEITVSVPEVVTKGAEGVENTV